MTHEEMLEEAAKREAANKPSREQMMQMAVGAIGKYTDALKALAETEKVELRAELESKKKKNFQLVADACMKEYEQKYQRDVFPCDESWVYMVGEYFGTGEGQTTCIMMTQANAGHAEDFEKSTNKYVPTTTKQYRAVRAFHKEFGTWMLYGLRFLTKEDFYTEWAYYIPPVMMKLSNSKCYKTFYTEVHYNFS
jgi:DNA-binding helix-hairpin-helix protein with protein kinase domain